MNWDLNIKMWSSNIWHRINSFWWKDLIILSFLILVVWYIQNEFLRLVLTMGLKPDDWILYFYYKVLGDDPLSKIKMVWAERGAYTTYQLYFIGLLGNLIGFDWQLFRQINIYFKILATLSLYPLILIIFKNRLLAILSTVIFAMSYSSVGPFEFVVKGSDYLAIFWMNIFLIVYYLIIRNKLTGLRWLITRIILLLLTIIFSPIRLYPILIVLPLIEIYLLIIKYKFTSIKKTFLRLFSLYLPFLVVVLYSPQAILGFLSNPFDIIKSGNWHLFLIPFSGLGYLFIPNQYYGKIFGTLNTNTFQDYVFFLLGGPTVIFSVLTLFVGFLRVNKPIRFILTVIILNFIIELLIFFLAFHYKFLSVNLQQHYDQTGLYSVLAGVYILILSGAVFIKWAKNKYPDNLLIALSLGGLFSIIFTVATWIAAPTLVSYSATSYYLVVASVGSSIFIAAILTIIFDKLKSTKKLLFRLFWLSMGSAILITIFFVSRIVVKERFTYFNLNGLNLMEQQLLQDKFKATLGKTDKLSKALFFFDTSKLSGNGPVYSEGFLVSFPFWMHFDGKNLREGCIEVIYENKDKTLLIKTIKEAENEKGFYYRGLCWQDNKWGYHDILYKVENFYAFQIVNGEFINITDGVLYELGFK